jgi:hypothetical protein
MNFLQLLASGASSKSLFIQSSILISSPKTLNLSNPSPVSSINPQDSPKSLHLIILKLSTHYPKISLPIRPIYSNKSYTIHSIQLENERQDLINQYLQLNIHLLEGKVSIPQSKPNQFDSENLADEAEDKEELEAP